MGTYTSVAEREALVDSYRSRMVTARAYTTAPGGARTAVTGAGYSDQTITWTDSSETDAQATASVTFTIPANVGVQSVGLLDSGGTVRDEVAVSYAAQTSSGTLTVNLTYSQA